LLVQEWEKDRLGYTSRRSESEILGQIAGPGLGGRQAWLQAVRFEKSQVVTRDERKTCFK
jgi:hypothetical protein